jgi:transcriptional regulator with XRE-family HTH domain
LLLLLEPYVIVGERLRAIRAERKLSLDDVAKRTDLPARYVSEVENGHTVPDLATLEKLARALQVSVYQLFYTGEGPRAFPNLPNRKTTDEIARGASRGKT